MSQDPRQKGEESGDVRIGNHLTDQDPFQGMKELLEKQEFTRFAFVGIYLLTPYLADTVGYSYISWAADTCPPSFTWGSQELVTQEQL